MHPVYAGKAPNAESAPDADFSPDFAWRRRFPHPALFLKRLIIWDFMAAEEEVLGKAYDSRLMKRLLGYLRPYWWQVAITLVAIVLKAGADVLGPYLTKTAIDKYLAHTAAPPGWLDRFLSSQPLVGIAQIAAVYVGLLLFGFLLEFIQTSLMQWTGQKVGLYEFE